MLLFKIWKTNSAYVWNEKSGENALLGNKLLSLRHTRPKIVNLWHKNYQKLCNKVARKTTMHWLSFSSPEISLISSIVRLLIAVRWLIAIWLLITRIWINIITILIDMFQKKSWKFVHCKNLHRSVCKLRL